MLEWLQTFGVLLGAALLAGALLAVWRLGGQSGANRDHDD